ncbi:SPOR domain-containing protein [Ramlibacter albus]|uniref:SPOR domain-containing protein n=1 Tax=Ramlibacter albus TaxID=2079448 RepID=A0A923M725_9BURK|nr:SPOR domain-containing protein [Ramlibacter albus]MBC5764098.1 SPOR domain-containing protein [Ramlibacter albus]
MAHSKLQGGNVVVGIIIGVVLGLAAALAVAVYVTKVPVPFLNKGTARTAEQDAAESKKNQNWDPNAPLYGKNPARPMPSTPPAGTASGPAGVLPLPPPLSPPEKDSKEAKGDKPAGAASAAKKSADPLGDLAAARAAAASPVPPAVAGGDPFLYFVQAGAFRTAEDAEAQRAKLSLMGIESKVTEREQSGRQVWRVRVGPFNTKDEADRSKEKLEAGGVETALVRVQR